jgi:hypothetical protein
VSQDDNQDTRESPALDEAEVEFSKEDLESVGDPAAAGTDTAATAADGEPPEGSPAAAQQRAEGDGGLPPEVQILGAFVGAFVLAKLLQWLFSRD